MALQTGQRLSHYQLAEKIGEGGMGEVWKATDTTLARSVAIKILPESLSHDTELLARFEREARLLASLNHPNIAVIHGLHHSGTTHFLAMELVAGEDLARRLRRGALPVPEVIRLGRQVAEAVEAAHEQGVIHRDLKPANIMISHEGSVKVLDFGLAKSLVPEGTSGVTDPSLSPTLTGAATRTGVILGTAAYMSPEQARGRAVDRRADIWAFGCVLFEMLVGRPPFAGETISDTLAAVLKSEPDWSALPREAPAGLLRLVRRCLVKDPRRRLRDLGEARIRLENLERGTDEEDRESAAHAATVTVGQRPRPRVVLLWLGLLVILAAAAGLAGWSLRRPPAELPLRKFRLAAGSGNHVGAILSEPALSPDGQRVAYVAEKGIWVQDLGRLEPRFLVTAGESAGLFWSPDGAWLGYFSERKIWKIMVSGGAPIAVCALKSPSDSSQGAAWFRDGRIVFATGDGGLYEVPAVGGDPSEVLPVGPDESDFHDAAPLPVGRGVLFLVHRKAGRDTLAVYAEGKRKDLLRLEGQVLDEPVYSPTGHVLFSRGPTNSGIWALPFSVAELRATGKPFLVAADAMSPSVSRDGTLAYREGLATRLSQLVWVDRSGREIGTIGRPQKMDPFPRLSPDSRRIAVTVEGGEAGDIWILDAARGTQMRLTFSPEAEIVPTWSPAGERVIFTKGLIPTDFKLVARAVDGTGSEEVLGPGIGASYSPDGSTIAYAATKERSSMAIYLMSLTAEHKRTPFVQADAVEVAPEISPGGSLLAYQSNESGRDEIYLKGFPGGEGKWQVSVNGGNWPRWNGRGDRLYYMERDNLMEVAVTVKPAVALGPPIRLFTREPSGTFVPFGWPEAFDVTPDGQRFLLLKKASDESQSGGPVIVQNWYSEFVGKEPGEEAR